jgi:hypothetical protein
VGTKTTQKQTTASKTKAAVRKFGETHGYPDGFMESWVQQESNFNPDAESDEGAIGLLQMKEETARPYLVELGLDPDEVTPAQLKKILRNPRQHLVLAHAHYSDLLDKSDGDHSMALTKWVAGETNVRRGTAIGDVTKSYAPDITGRVDGVEVSEQTAAVLGRRPLEPDPLGLRGGDPAAEQPAREPHFERELPGVPRPEGTEGEYVPRDEALLDAMRMGRTDILKRFSPEIQQRAVRLTQQWLSRHRTGDVGSKAAERLETIGQEVPRGTPAVSGTKVQPHTQFVRGKLDDDGNIVQTKSILGKRAERADEEFPYLPPGARDVALLATDMSEFGVEMGRRGGEALSGLAGKAGRATIPGGSTAEVLARQVGPVSNALKDSAERPFDAAGSEPIGRSTSMSAREPGMLDSIRSADATAKAALVAGVTGHTGPGAQIAARMNRFIAGGMNYVAPFTPESEVAGSLITNVAIETAKSMGRFIEDPGKQAREQPMEAVFNAIDVATLGAAMGLKASRVVEAARLAARTKSIQAADDFLDATSRAVQGDVVGGGVPAPRPKELPAGPPSPLALPSPSDPRRVRRGRTHRAADELAESEYRTLQGVEVHDVRPDQPGLITQLADEYGVSRAQVKREMKANAPEGKNGAEWARRRLARIKAWKRAQQAERDKPKNVKTILTKANDADPEDAAKVVDDLYAKAEQTPQNKPAATKPVMTGLSKTADELSKLIRDARAVGADEAADRYTALLARNTKAEDTLAENAAKIADDVTDIPESNLPSSMKRGMKVSGPEAGFVRDDLAYTLGRSVAGGFAGSMLADREDGNTWAMTTAMGAVAGFVIGSPVFWKALRNLPRAIKRGATVGGKTDVDLFSGDVDFEKFFNDVFIEALPNKPVVFGGHLVNFRQTAKAFFLEGGTLSPELREIQMRIVDSKNGLVAEMADNSRTLRSASQHEKNKIEDYLRGNASIESVPEKYKVATITHRMLWDEIGSALIEAEIVGSSESFGIVRGFLGMEGGASRTGRAELLRDVIQQFDEVIESGQDIPASVLRAAKDLKAAETVESNLGTYLPRMYLAYEAEDPLRAYNEFARHSGGLARSEKELARLMKKDKDLSAETRKALGEISAEFDQADPGFLMQRGGPPLAAEIAASQWGNFIASHVDLTLADDIVDEALTAGNIIDGEIIRGNKIYRRMPESRRYGKLAGKFVDRDIAWDFEAMAHLGQSSPMDWLKKTAAKGTAFFKKGKVTWNPATLMRNIYGQLPMTDLGGVHPMDYKHIFPALMDYKRGGPMYQEARKGGLMGGEFLAGEIGELARRLEGDKSWVKAQLKWGESKIAKNTLGQMERFHNASEQANKMILYAHARNRLGMDVAGAVRHAKKFGFDYREVPRWINVVRHSPFGAPFITFSYKSIPRVMEAMMGVKTVPGAARAAAGQLGKISGRGAVAGAVVGADPIGKGNPFSERFDPAGSLVGAAVGGAGGAVLGKAASAAHRESNFLRFWKYPMAFGAVNEYSSRAVGARPDEDHGAIPTMKRMAAATIGLGIGKKSWSNAPYGEYMADWVGAQQMTLPWRDAYGRMQFLDLTWILPWGDFGEVGKGNLGKTFGKVGIPFPRQLEPSNPWLMTLLGGMSHMNVFTGKPIHRAEPDVVTAFQDGMKFMTEQWLPDLTPGVPGLTKGGRGYEKIKNAVLGNNVGDPNAPTLGSALAGGIAGLKARGTDPMTGAKFQMFALERRMRDAEGELRKASETGDTREAKRLQKAILKIGEEMKALSKAAAKLPKTPRGLLDAFKGKRTRSKGDLRGIVEAHE